MAASLYNLARMTTGTTGAGTITLGSAVSGFLSFSAAGVSDGETVTYAIQDGTASEIGRGVYTASGTTLTRSVLKSTNSNAAISLTGNAQVFITAAAEDFNVRTTAETTFGTDNRIVRSDGTGRGVQSSAITINDDGSLSGVANVTGVDASFVTGTAGAANKLAKWNSDGDLVEGPSGGDITVTSYTTGSGTYTVPANVRALKVTVVGGGGGGAGATVSTSTTEFCSAGGGGSGGAVIKFIANANLAASYSYAVGAGGAGGAAGTNNGSAGTATTFSGTGVSLSAGGGGGAVADTQSSTATAFPGGSGGAASGGNINIAGGVGFGGVTAGNYVNGAGNGASSLMGVGGSLANGDGNNGTGYGSGGAGAGMIPNFATALSRAGGDGAGGIIIIEEFY